MAPRPTLELVTAGRRSGEPGTPAVTDALRDRRVLVAGEDEFLLGYVGAVLAAAGARVIGPFPNGNTGDASRGSEGAIVEMDSSGTWIGTAEALAEAGVPFVLVGGRTPSDRPARFRDRPLLPRPFAAFQVVDALVALLGTG